MSDACRQGLQVAERALKEGESAGALHLRAECWRQMGRPARALADLRRAATIAPARRELWMLRARVHFDQGQYAAARRALSRALELAPSAEAFELRAQVCLLQNRFRAALADLEQALRFSPLAWHLQARRVRALAALGRDAEARGRVAWLRGQGERVWADWSEGYLACRAGTHAQAAALFASAAQAARERGMHEFAVKCSRYRAAALALGDPALRERARRDGARLRLVGLGMGHPWQVTAEALPALAESDLILNNLSDPEVSEFLGLLGVGIVDIVFRVGGDLAKCGRKVARSLERHRRVAFVTRGNPVVFGPLGFAAAGRCRELGVPFRAVPALGMASLLLGRLVGALGGAARGLQILGQFPPLRYRWRPARRLPVVLYSGFLLDGWAVADYPEGHPAYVSGPGDLPDSDPRREELARLPALRRRYPDASVFFIPPAAGETSGEPRDSREGGGLVPGPEVLVCGLGPEAPWQATLETLGALQDRDVVFCDQRLRAALEGSVLAGLMGRLRYLDTRGAGAAPALMEALGQGERAALLLAGHPVLFSEAQPLLMALGARGLRWRALPALSALDVFVSRHARFLGMDCGGIQAVRFSDLAGGRLQLDPHNPLLVCLDEEPSETAFAGFCARLLTEQGPERACVLLDPALAPVGDGFQVAALPRRRAQARAGCFLSVAGEGAR